MTTKMRRRHTGTHQGSAPNLFNASIPSTTKYWSFLSASAPSPPLLRYTTTTSSARALPSAAARSFATVVSSKMDSSRNLRTFQSVMSDVGEEEMTMIGISLPVQSVLVSKNTAMGREQTGTFARCFRVYHKALDLAPEYIRSFEMLTRFRGGSLHIARLLCLA